MYFCKVSQSLAVLLVLLLFWSCNQGGVQHQNLAAERGPDPFKRLEEEWLTTLKGHFPVMSMLTGEPIERLPHVSPAALEEQAADAAAFLTRLQEIDPMTLSHQDQLTHGMMALQMQQMQDAAKFGDLQFSVTPYQLGFVLTAMLPTYLSNVPLETETDRDTYARRVEEVAAFIAELADKSERQTEKGILLPKPAIPGVRVLLSNISPLVHNLAQVPDSALEGLSPEAANAFREQVAHTLTRQVDPAAERLASHYGNTYFEKAGDAIGMGQYPGGKDCYQFLIRVHTTLDLSPESIHERGLAHQAKLDEAMASIRRQLGFEGSAEAFHKKLREDSRYYAKSPEEVAARFDSYIQRIEPLLKDYFAVLPNAPYGVKRLDPANEAGMTFGYYQVPNATEPRGLYRFNGSKLDERPMIWAGPLIYHELVPGHHFHLALQKENETLSAYRKQGMSLTAFNEGWANYAASLAVDMGLLDDPMAHYGWLLFDSFITARLVLDTGLNYYGWSMEKATAYMLAHTFQSEAEVTSELLRYSTDMPAQALSYKLGFEHLLDLRQSMKAKYGQAFDIKDFHTAVVGSGALPMPLVSSHVAWYLGQKYR